MNWELIPLRCRNIRGFHSYYGDMRYVLIRQEHDDNNNYYQTVGI